MATVLATAEPLKKPCPVTGGWLPQSPQARIDFLKVILDEGREYRKHHKLGAVEELDPTVADLKNLIEDSAQLSMLFKSMFEEIPFSHRNDPIGKAYNITNYDQLLQHFNMLLTEPPRYNENLIIALPFTLLLEWPMATRGGLAAFLDKDVNAKIGAILNKWGEYLEDPNRDSKKYLVNNPKDRNSWLSQSARDIMRKRDPKHREFEDLYECDPQDKHLGFTTWDHFFTRQFKDYKKVRPVENPEDNYISSGCESAPYAIKQLVKMKEKFWIKGQPYSLRHMLASEEDAKKFAGGTVYQAFLSPLTYHRWHSPINGYITKLRLVSGSYFSISPINAFPDPETFANTQSQPYLSAVATRALIFLENSTVGEMVMIPVGMVEVSTCEFNKTILDQMKVDPQDPTGQTWIPKGNRVEVSKGDELGMFHFGGSTHCLVFQPQVELRFWQRAIPLDTEDNYFVPLNATLAEVRQRTPEEMEYLLSFAEDYME
ncbi:hypothetical protein VKT23_008622 [Stygiomarasmius scandens]|uniref:L-tryptophan decarboxylase PsiD-like domain-containing protein n=1 Tax=Marasmiellus scandens TaxID=2682957 RepID=A0ABR1JJH6_9AGAR